MLALQFSPTTTTKYLPNQMASKSLYQRYLKIISKWPLDKSKEGRDLATHIRSRMTKHFAQGEQTVIESSRLASLESEVVSLEKLVNNVHCKQNPPASPGYTGATGIPLNLLHRATSTQFIADLNSLYEAGPVNRLKFQLLSMFK